MNKFQKAIQYQDPYTKIIENLMQKKLEPILDKMEESFFNQLKNSKDIYLKAGEFLGIQRLDAINSFVYLENFRNPLLNILNESYRMSYKLGKKHILKELNLKSPNLLVSGDEEKSSIHIITKSAVEDYIQSYHNIIHYVMVSVMKENKNFIDFYKEVYNHPTFGKRKFKKAEDSQPKQIQGGVFSSGSMFISDVPSKSQFLGNAKAFVIKSFNKARMEVFDKLGIGERVLYKTQEDEKVSSICKPFHDQEMSREKAESSIPRHINCRCTFVPL